MRVLTQGGGSSGAGYDAVATQMVLDNVSTASTEGAWKLADRREVFDRLAFNLYEIQLAQKTATGAFDSIADAATIASVADFKTKINNSTYLSDIGLTSAALIDYYKPTMTGASYASKSFSVNTQESTPNAVCFSSDGTKMYVLGQAADTVFQYTLSTAGDVSTASYAVKSFSVNTQESTPVGLAFSSDGTKMYVVGSANDTIYQYTLSTAWDISTAAYASKSFSVSSQTTSPSCLKFAADGSAAYVMGGSTIYQYTLSTAWDVSTASYASKSFSVGSQEVSPFGFAISKTGERLFAVGHSSDRVYQYTLSTAGDISTASYDSVSLLVSGQDAQPTDLTFSENQQTLYVLGQSGVSVYQYTVEVAL